MLNIEVQVLNAAANLDQETVSINCTRKTLRRLIAYGKARDTLPPLIIRRDFTYSFVGIPIVINGDIEDNVLSIWPSNVDIFWPEG